MANRKPDPRIPDLEAAVTTALGPKAAKLTAALKKLINHKHARGLWRLDFEIFSNCGDDVSFVWFLYRRGFDQILWDDKGYPTRIKTPILTLPTLFPAALLRKFKIGKNDDWHVEPAEHAACLWFHDCWRRAGGDKFGPAATVAPHDTATRLDLRTGKWKRDA